MFHRIWQKSQQVDFCSRSDNVSSMMNLLDQNSITSQFPHNLTAIDGWENAACIRIRRIKSAAKSLSTEKSHTFVSLSWSLDNVYGH